jgi:hypothetical protein
MENNFDIFNLSLDNFKTEEKKTEVNPIYKTDPKLSKDSIYRAIVRFIPNIKDPKKSIIKKFSYWLENAEGNGFYMDCPSSINDKSIIQDTFWKLFKSESAFDKKQSEKMKRKEYYYSYIYVVKDPQRPEMENTVQILRYPKSVKKLIDSQISPDASDIELGVEPTNIFDFFQGKDFSLKVTLKGGYWNYDECKFASGRSPITLNGVKMENNSESRTMVMGLYGENLQSLDVHSFKPWTDDDREKVHSYLAELTGNPGRSYSAVASSPRVSAPPSPAPTSNSSTGSVQPTSIDDAVSASAAAVDGSTNADVEDWLKQFDLK